MSIQNDVFWTRRDIEQLDTFVSDCLDVMNTEKDLEDKREFLEMKQQNNFPQIRDDLLPSMHLLSGNINLLIDMFCSGSMSEPALKKQLEEHSRELKESLKFFKVVV